MSLQNKADSIRENVPKVYEAGEMATAKSEAMWRAIQRAHAAGDYGAIKTNYNYAFHLFNTNYFYPQFDIAPTHAAFFARDMVGESIDLVERLAECGVSMDFSACKTCSYLFYNAKFYHLPELDLRNMTGQPYFIFGNGPVTVDKLILADTGTQNVSELFSYASTLKNIVVEGVIGANGNFSLKHCKNLTLASAKSILTALQDVTGTDKENLYTVTLHDNTRAILEADGATAPGGVSWLEYVNAKGWNI